MRWRSLSTDGSPDFYGMLIAEALSEASTTAKGECYAALVRLYYDWMEPVATHPDD